MSSKLNPNAKEFVPFSNSSSIGLISNLYKKSSSNNKSTSNNNNSASLLFTYSHPMNNEDILAENLNKSDDDVTNENEFQQEIYYHHHHHPNEAIYDSPGFITDNGIYEIGINKNLEEQGTADILPINAENDSEQICNSIVDYITDYGVNSDDMNEPSSSSMCFGNATIMDVGKYNVDDSLSAITEAMKNLSFGSYEDIEISHTKQQHEQEVEENIDKNATYDIECADDDYNNDTQENKNKTFEINTQNSEKRTIVKNSNSDGSVKEKARPVISRSALNRITTIKNTNMEKMVQDKVLRIQRSKFNQNRTDELKKSKNKPKPSTGVNPTKPTPLSTLTKSRPRTEPCSEKDTAKLNMENEAPEAAAGENVTIATTKRFAAIRASRANEQQSKTIFSRSIACKTGVTTTKSSNFIPMATAASGNVTAMNAPAKVATASTLPLHNKPASTAKLSVILPRETLTSSLRKIKARYANNATGGTTTKTSSLMKPAK